MKIKVICDTNIWYYLGDRTIKPEELNDYCLIATFYNFDELNSTPKTVKDFSKVQAAAKAIVDNSCDQYLENAILYLTKLIYPLHEDKRYHYNLGIRNWNEIHLLGNLPSNFKPSEEIGKLYERNIEIKTNESEAVSAIENSLAGQVRKQSRKLWKEDKVKYFKSSLSGIISLLNNFLNGYSEGKAQLTKDFDIRKIELFLSAFVFYYKKLEIGKMKAQPNDMYDLFNMVYVRPGDKYFTRDGRWVSIINEAGLSNYLLSYPPY